MDAPEFIHSPLDGRLDGFWFCAAVNEAAVNIWIDTCGTSGLCGAYVQSMFNFIRIFQTVLQVARPFCIPSSSVWVTVTLQPCQKLVLAVFFIFYNMR